MSAQKFSLPQADGLDTLRELIEFAKNPDSIVEAQETARKQIQLTEDEQAKMTAARAFIADYEAKSKELKEGEEALVSAQDKLLRDIGAWQENIRVEKEGIEKQRNELKAITDNQESIALSFVGKDRDLIAYKKQLDEAYAEKLKLLEVRERDVAGGEEVNKNEADRLADLRQKLGAKAALYRQAEEV